MYNNMQAIEGISEKKPGTFYTVFCQTGANQLVFFHNSQKLVSKYYAHHQCVYEVLSKRS